MHIKKNIYQALVWKPREVISKYINQYSNNHFKQEDIIIGPGTKQLMFLLQLGLRESLFFLQVVGYLMNLKLKLLKTKFIG